MNSMNSAFSIGFFFGPESRTKVSWKLIAYDCVISIHSEAGQGHFLISYSTPVNVAPCVWDVPLNRAEGTAPGGDPSAFPGSNPPICLKFPLTSH